MELCALALAKEKRCCQWNRSFGGGTKHKPNQVFNLKNYFLFYKLLDNLVLFSEMFLTNDKACTTYTFSFIAKKITTLKILQVFPSLTKQQKSQCWGELIFTCACLATKFSFVHFVNRARVTSVSANIYCHHKIQKCQYALWTPFTIVMFRRLNVELVQSYDCFFCVKLYCNERQWP